MSIDYTILGVLLDAPTHGYSIKKYLAETFSQDFGLNDGQLYPTLAKLETRGWIRKRVVPQRRSPAKHLYSITPDGEEAFYRWLADSGTADERARGEFFWKHELLQKCVFFGRLSGRRVEAQVRLKLEEVSRRIAEFERVLADMEARRLDPYRQMVVEYGLRFERMRHDWLEELLERARQDGSAADEPVAARAT
jgi:DNA-binding PadR family transcriptional regulator